MKLRCYAVELNPPEIVPASPTRAWMDNAASRHPYRCLPLSVANVYGWTLLSPASFSIHWNGGPETSDLRFESHDGFAQLGRYVTSNFAGGIATFHTGYIFRTEPGWDLLVTGPFNEPKDGISPLSGVVETDWLPYTFTMNWQMTRPGVVRFDKGEPFCLLTPTPKHALEETEPVLLDLESDPELTRDYRMWREERDWFRVSARAGDPQAVREAWQKFYFHGELPSGRRWTDDHTRKLRLSVASDEREAQRGTFANRPLSSAGPTASPAVRSEGFIDVPGGRIWHQVVGHGAGTPLVALPGGCGFPHDHLRPLAALGDERPIVFFDPLGCGRSDRPNNPALFTIEHTAVCVERLREALQLEHLALFGHGVGAAHAIEVARRNGRGIRGLVLASPCLAMSDWSEGIAAAIQRLPPPMQEILRQGDNPAVLRTELFQAAVRAYFREALCRREPWPQVLEQTLAGVGPDVFVSQWGPNPVHCTAAMRQVDLRGALAELRVPVLLTCGTLDLATPTAVENYRQRINGSALRVFEGSSHMVHLDDPAAYRTAVADFLRPLDA